MGAEVTINSILLIVLLVVPGVFFKRFYFQGHFAKQFGFGLFADRLITSIFWGFLIQILTFLSLSKAFGFTYDNIKKPVLQFYFQLSEKKIPDFSIENLWYTFGYLISSIIIASILGGFFHKFVRILKIDIRYPIFRFANQWHYYFKGEILHSSDFKRYKKGKWLSTLVDALVDNGDGTNKMVSGFLTQYLISSKTGELETIYLTESRRFSKSKNQFVDIPGDCLIIPYNRVVDLNIRYNIKVDDKDKKDIFSTVIFPSIALVAFLYLLLLPFFLNLSIFKIILGLLASTLSWMLLVAIVGSGILNNTSKERLKGKALFYMIFIFIITSTLTWYIYM